MSDVAFERSAADSHGVTSGDNSQAEQWRITDGIVTAKRAAKVALQDELVAASQRVNAASAGIHSAPNVSENPFSEQITPTQELDSVNQAEAMSR